VGPVGQCLVTKLKGAWSCKERQVWILLWNWTLRRRPLFPSYPNPVTIVSLTSPAIAGGHGSSQAATRSRRNRCLQPRLPPLPWLWDTLLLQAFHYCVLITYSARITRGSGEPMDLDWFNVLLRYENILLLSCLFYFCDAIQSVHCLPMHGWVEIGDLCSSELWLDFLILAFSTSHL